MAKGLFARLKASFFPNWKPRGRDKRGAKARWNLGRLKKKKVVVNK